MRETLRLSPTAPNRTVTPLEDTTLKGKFPVKKGDRIFMNSYTMHRDPKVWGDDVRGSMGTSTTLLVLTTH